MNILRIQFLEAGNIADMNQIHLDTIYCIKNPPSVSQSSKLTGPKESSKNSSISLYKCI